MSNSKFYLMLCGLWRQKTRSHHISWGQKRSYFTHHISVFMGNPSVSACTMGRNYYRRSVIIFMHKIFIKYLFSYYHNNHYLCTYKLKKYLVNLKKNACYFKNDFNTLWTDNNKDLMAVVSSVWFWIRILRFLYQQMCLLSTVSFLQNR